MSEDNLQKAIEFLDQGKSPAEIFNLLGTEKEAKNLVEIAYAIKTEKNQINPSQALRSKIRASLAIAQEKEAQSSGIIVFLQNKLKIFLPMLAAVAVMLLIFVPKTRAPIKTDEIVFAPIKPQANIDETTKGIIADYTSDNSITSQGDSDIKDIQQTFSNYDISHIYNEESF